MMILAYGRTLMALAGLGRAMRTPSVAVVVRTVGPLVALCLPIVLSRVAAASSLSFVVNSTADASDASPGDSTCATSAGDCSLRAAVEEADAQPAASTIMVTLPAGTYNLTLGALALTANTITINGDTSSTTTVDAGGLSGVFTIAHGVTAMLTGMTISDGIAATGGGINNAGTLSLDGTAVLNNTTSNVGANGGTGGGIWSSGSLTVNNSLISGNSTATGGFGSGNPAGNGGNGGGIWSSSTLTITASTISNNAAGSGGYAPNDAPGNGGAGGGIYIKSGTVTISGSTVTGNSTGYGGNGEENTLAGNGGNGGGIWNGSTLHLTDCTISDNSTGRGGLAPTGVGGSGGGIWNSGTVIANGSAITANAAGPGTAYDASTPGNGGGVWNSGSLTATNCTVSNNTAAGGGPSAAGGAGGGIYGSAGTVNLTDTTISNNTAGTGGNGGLGGFDSHYGEPGGVGGNGGGIWNGAALTVTTSTLSWNSGGTGGLGGCGPVTCAASGAGGNGGAIWNSGTAQLTNSTLGTNTAGPGGAVNCGYGMCGTAGASGVGGALLESGGTATLTYATVADNSDGLVNSGGSVTLTGSIITSSQNGPNCSGTISEGMGYNLDSGSTCALSAATDLSATDPLLASFADNGGPTLTMALLAGSPAVDHGGSAANGCPTTDQRAVTRPQGGACDIGAFESNGVVGPTITPTVTPGGPTPTPTDTLPPSPTDTPTATPSDTPMSTPTDSPAPAVVDVALRAPRPLTITIPSGTSAVMKKLKVTVRNADATTPRTVQLSVDPVNCPAGAVGAPVFGNGQSSILVPKGATKTATLPLTIAAADFTSFNFKAPSRCTMMLTATAVVAGGSVDPNPSNNSAGVELNVVNKNSTEQTATHETTIKSAAPVAISIPRGASTKAKTLVVTVGNADYRPTAEHPGDSITLSASTSCTGLTVRAPVCTKSPPSATATVAGGVTRRCTLVATTAAAQIGTPTRLSPQRCIVTLAAVGPSYPETAPLDASNDTTELSIDVIDGNDY